MCSLTGTRRPKRCILRSLMFTKERKCKRDYRDEQYCPRQRSSQMGHLSIIVFKKNVTV